MNKDVQWSYEVESNLLASISENFANVIWCYYYNVYKREN